MDYYKDIKPLFTAFAKNQWGITDETIADSILESGEKLYHRFPGVTLEMALLFLPIIKLKTLTKGEHFIKQGQKKNEFAFIAKGILRSYFTDSAGEESTFIMGQEGDMCSCWEPLLLNKPISINIDAVEDCLLACFDLDDLNKLMKKSPDLERLYYTSITELFADSLIHYQNAINRKPRARYLDLYYNRPELLHRLPKNIVASYIGVTPVSYSRLKKRLEREVGIEDI